MIGIDSDSVSHFEYRIFLILPDLTTESNCVDEIKKILNKLRTLLFKLVTHVRDINEQVVLVI